MQGLGIRVRVRHMVLGVCLLATAGGCSQVTRVEQADAAERMEVDGFLHEHLPAAPMVTTAGAYRAMVILADGDDGLDGFEARESELKERGIVRSDWNLTREACIDRGTLAYMVCQVLEIKGGVNRATLGALGVGDRRYAVRELAYRGLLPNTPTYRYISGGELLDLMAQADRYMAEHGLYEEQTEDLADVLESDTMRQD